MINGRAKTPSVPSDPALWGRIKRKHRATDEGSPPGRWSARKAALARREYELQGGRFVKGGGVGVRKMRGSL